MTNVSANANTQLQASTAILGKAMDSQKMQGASVVQMMQTSAPAMQISDPAMGNNVNLLA